MNIKFTPRERRIAVLVTEGLKNKEIAKRLGTGEYGVRNCVSRIYEKSGMWTRVEFALWWLTHTALLFCLFSTPAAARVTVQSVTVAPSSATIAAGSAQQFAATAHYSNGTVGDVTASATWKSSSNAVATVNAGNASGVKAGTATITATFSAKAGTATLTVTAAPPGTTIISFDSPTCPNGNTGASLTGVFQGINWGNSPWDCEVAGSPTDTTTSASWNVDQTSATFSFVTPSVLKSLKAGTSSGSGTYSISTDGPVLLISTGFVNPATTITIGFTGGWTVETDDITYTTPPAVQCNPHSVSLTWVDADPVTFNIYRSGTSGSSYSPIATGLTTTSYADLSTPAGTYYYVVTAVDNLGVESAYSAQTSAIVPCQ